MEALDYWRLCDELTVVQAALLLVGEDPSSTYNYVEKWEAEHRPPGYEAAKTAISNRLLKGDLIGDVVPIYNYDINGNRMSAFEGSIDVCASRIDVESLRRWLRSRGMRTGFFFPSRTKLLITLIPIIRATRLSWRRWLRHGLQPMSPH